MKKYWKSLEGRDNPGVDQGEHHDDSNNDIIDLLSGDTVHAGASRRDFLKLCGFSFTAAAMAASCKRPVQKAIPYLIQPEEIIPGKSLHYASTYFDGHEYASILVKTRDGRPIKIEANDMAAFGGTGTSARIQASVLGLYDDARYKQPVRNGESLSWEETDNEITGLLRKISQEDGEIAILSPTIISPSTMAVIRQFQDTYPGTRLVIYDPISYSGMLEANRLTFGEAIIPSYQFDKAEVIVSFGADFLGTWLAPVHFTGQYSSRKTLDEDHPDLIRHYQFETGMTITGSVADRRIAIKPSQEKALIAKLYNELASVLGSRRYDAPAPGQDLRQISAELMAHRGESLVVSGSSDPGIQLMVNGINQMLGNYGSTIDPGRVMHLKQGLDTEIEQLVADMEKGLVKAAIFINSNPVYDFQEPAMLRQGLDKLELKISLSTFPDETSELCEYICPSSHYLESWSDAEPLSGHLSIAQPVIRPLFKTRTVQDTLMKWAGIKGDFYSYIKSYWERNIFPQQDKYADFSLFWNSAVQSGYLKKDISKNRPVQIKEENLVEVFNSVDSLEYKEEIELDLYESIQLGTGSHANNPWLMELPDPVSKVSWDNYAAMSPKLAGELGLINGDIVSINDRLELPVLVQPGQANGTVSIALGYGRTKGGKVAVGVGANAFSLITQAGRRNYFVRNASIKKLDRRHELALSQEHHSLEGREIIREASLKEYASDPYAGNHKHIEVEKHHQTLYPEVEFDGYHWGMAIDLTKCTGCSSCVIACQAENNIAVVGRDEVRKRRIMHWIRIDRYYSDEPENPQVHFQPVMCQHCDNAPCENVCPVSATNHSNEGINQMSYNRCIGTKYCINNCPYRVRRFNWYAYVNNDEFDYHQNSQLGKMVLNPDVVVRERGVVEKCSFCVQRIQEKKMAAKLDERKIMDQEIIPACSQSCPAGAIVFGDLNDPESKVSKLMANPRNYHLLEELHTLPSIGYMTKIKNT